MLTYIYDLDEDSSKIKTFDYIFRTFGLPSRVVELGVYAGRTTFQVVEALAPVVKDLQYYAIDPYSTSIDIKEDLEGVYKHFTNQLESFVYRDRITHLREKSFDGLLKLKSIGFKPQLIYIDGDHTASAVLNDLVMSFDILEKGGLILCDDAVTWKYFDQNGQADPQMSPKMAIDAFTSCNWSKLKLVAVPNGTQTAFLKL